MQGFDTKSFIEQARAKGVPDSETFNYLNSKNLIPKESVVSAPVSQPKQQQKAPGAIFASSPTDSGLVAGGKALANLPGSAYQTGKSLVSAVMNPVDTLKGVGSVALGGAQKLIPGQQESEQNFDAVVDSFKGRYGSLEAAQKTATEDPFGFGSDVLALFSGIGGAAKLAGLKAPGVATAVSKIPGAAKVAKATEAYGKFSFPEWFGNAFQKSSLNLTPAQKATFSNKLGDVASFLNKEKAIGTPEMKFKKMEKLTEQKYEPQIQATLKSNNTIKADTAKVQDSIRSLKQEFFNDNDFDAISRRVDAVADSLGRYKDGIPLDALNQLKRSTFKDAFNRAGDKVTDVLEFAIADKYYENLIDMFKTNNLKVNGVDLDVFNKTYKTAIEAKKILNVARKRPLAGFISRITAAGLGAYFGNMVAGPAGAVIGPGVAQLGANVLGGTSMAAKGIAGKAISKAAPLNFSAPAGASAGVISGANANDDYLNQLGY